MDGRQLAKLAKISTAAHCQKACTENLQCDAFVWAASGTCLLASLDGAAPMMMAQEGLIAGQPCCRGAREGKVLTDCPEQMADTELRTSADCFAPDLQQLHADDAFKCQEACTKEHECGAFSWSPKGCVLKRLAPDESPRMIPKDDGVISGLPCGCREATAANAMWPHTDAEKFTMPLPRGMNKPTKPGSLLCLALMVPYSYETGLIVMQYKHHAGIFACDEYQVYSNQAMVLAPGLETRKVLSSQECEVGGEFKSALNLQIFTAFWRQVISDGHYLLYNWVIKADPDTVFFADRLRPILQKHQDGSLSQSSPGVYLNNCKFGLHGPLEVFSQSTVRALSTSFLGCFHFFEKLCNGDCQWGEDMWVDQCLKRFVQAERHLEPKLLMEAHCDPDPGWRSCSDAKTAAFHPFKSVADHITCQQSAELAELA
ncbi:unnamed protein product [Effrenium voratum]|nr:unnamed protein product [Effrenium voratum]